MRDAEPSDSGLFQTPAWSWTQAGEVGWWVRREWESALIDSNGLRLDQWRREGRLSTIKTGPQRVVYRADLSEGSVYVKHYLVPGLREKLRQWFRRGKGRNESKRALTLAAIGVPTITPIGLGEQRKHHFLLENYLVTPAIADTVPLNEFVEQTLLEYPQERQARIRQRLSQGLARLTAHLHDAGFVHGDFHPGNILVRLDEGDHPRLAMIDLDALRSKRSLSWKEARENLALLNHYFWVRCERSDRLRFLRAYLDARVESPPDMAAFASGIEKATRSWAERLWTRWGRRCRGGNKYFKRYRGDTSRAVASREMDRDEIRELLEDPDAPFRRSDAVILKESRTTTVAEVTLSVDQIPTRVIYKKFHCKKRLDPILNLFRPSRGWRAWQGGQHLSARAVETPRNLLFLAETGRGRRFDPRRLLTYATYLATIKADPSITLGDYALEVLSRMSPSERRSRIVSILPALAALIRILHERSLSHRDLKAANILIEGNPDSETPRLSLIDLVGVELLHPLPDHRRVQNLARLQVSLAEVPGRTRTDSLRFLKAYLPWNHTTRLEWKTLWRAVSAATLTKIEQNRRRGRPLS